PSHPAGPRPVRERPSTAHGCPAGARERRPGEARARPRATRVDRSRAVASADGAPGAAPDRRRDAVGGAGRAAWADDYGARQAHGAAAGRVRTDRGGPQPSPRPAGTFALNRPTRTA